MNRRRIDGVAALRPHVGGGCGRRSARSGRRPRPALFRLSLSNPQRGFCGSRVGAARLCHLPCAAVAAAVAVVAAAARLGEARRPTRAEIRSLTGKGGGGCAQNPRRSNGSPGSAENLRERRLPLDANPVFSPSLHRDLPSPLPLVRIV